MTAAPRSPFSPRAAIALFVLGTAAFLTLVWAMGAGLTGGSANDGGSHAGGKGLNGYAALADYLERRGHPVRRSRSAAALDDRGLLVLTPNPFNDGAELQKIVDARRTIGPTMIILPKWMVSAPPSGTAKSRKGWVLLGGTIPPAWHGFLDSVSIRIAPLRGSAQWQAGNLNGSLPQSQSILSGSGATLVPLVIANRDSRILAAYINDGGMYPGLEDMADTPPQAYGDNTDVYPLVLVFEPDLLDNYGMSRLANAQLADRLVAATTDNRRGPVIFDLTLNGLARSANLLTLAFTPPFLAATLCLLMAGLVAAWRAFLRFGPPLKQSRALVFGKQALVSNAAGLIVRSGRLHLVAAPYAAAARDRLAHALALPRMADAQASEAAIDRALAGRLGNTEPFSAIAARLRAARGPTELLRAAQDLHTLERTLTR